jgi:hypothetical protein
MVFTNVYMSFMTNLACSRIELVIDFASRIYTVVTRRK